MPEATGFTVQSSKYGAVMVRKYLHFTLQNTPSQLKVSCQTERRVFVSREGQSSYRLPLFQVLLYHLESPCILISQKSCHMLFAHVVL